jgi:hypothetical protein
VDGTTHKGNRILQRKLTKSLYSLLIKDYADLTEVSVLHYNSGKKSRMKSKAFSFSPLQNISKKGAILLAAIFGVSKKKDF